MHFADLFILCIFCLVSQIIAYLSKAWIFVHIKEFFKRIMVCTHLISFINYCIFNLQLHVIRFFLLNKKLAIVYVVTLHLYGSLDEINRHFAHVYIPSASTQQLDLLRKYESVSAESHLGGVTFSSVNPGKVLSINSNATGADISINMLRIACQCLFNNVTFILNTCIL